MTDAAVKIFASCSRRTWLCANRGRGWWKRTGWGGGAAWLWVSTPWGVFHVWIYVYIDACVHDFVWVGGVSGAPACLRLRTCTCLTKLAFGLEYISEVYVALILNNPAMWRLQMLAYIHITTFIQ